MISGTTDNSPPSSSSTVGYDISVASASPPLVPRGREDEREEQWSPGTARLPPPRTPASTRSRHRDNSSEYYTAAWGSPYQLPTSPSGSVHTALSEQLPNEEQLESSPIPNFGLEDLVPSRLGAPNLRPSSLSVLTTVVDDDAHTPRSRTKRWVQLPQRQLPERSPWRSDGSHSLSDKEKGHRRASSSVSVQAVERRSAKSHKKREENKTLNQQTFLEILRDDQDGEMSSLFASRWADTPPPDEEEVGQKLSAEPLTEKFLPQLPAEGEAAADAMKEGSEDEVKELGSYDQADLTPQPNMSGRTEATSNASPSLPSPDPIRLEAPRLRKKVSWRGKTCIVCIPNVDFEAFGLPMPLSSAEIQQRVKEFEDAGYSTRGFGLSYDEYLGSDSAHARPVYPDEAQIRIEASQQQPRVSLPDLNKWRAYEQQLVEAKLAALGVSLGLDEPPAPPAHQDMSRQSSGQYPPLPFSPPIPAGSAGSMGRPHMIRGHSHTMSVASPLSPGNGPFGHMHRHSTFTGPYGFPQLQTQQLPPHSQQSGMPGMQPFSPQKQLNMPGFPRGGSPAQLAALRQDFGPVRGPGSPLSQQMFAQSPQEYSRGLMDDQRRRAHTYSQSVQHQPAQTAFMPQMPPMQQTSSFQQVPSFQQTPMLPELPEEDDEEELQEPGPEPPAYVPPHKRAQFNPEVAVPTPTRGHRHNPSEGLERDVLQAEQRHEAETRDWVEVVEAPDKRTGASTAADESCLSEELPTRQAPHTHKKTASRFNVAAPAFNFNPAASSKPEGNAFTFGRPAPQPNGATVNGHIRQASSGSFNVAAPAFKPANPPSVPKTDFSFSAQGPASQLNVPAFETSKPQPNERAVVDELPSIFGKVSIPDIVKPARKSKAIAIVRPEEIAADSYGSSEEFEDEEGRPMQSDDRLKRQRKGGDDGDEVPRFAEPSSPPPMPVAAVAKESSPTCESIMHAPNIDSAEAEDHETLGGSLDKGGEMVEATAEEADLHHHEVSTSTGKIHGHKPSSSLSAFARPFEPGAFQMPAEAKVAKGHEQFASISELEDGEIREDEPAELSPVRSREPIPVHMPFDYSALGRIDQVAQPEPSFDEIDAVMRQLNDAEAGAEPEKRDGGAMSPLPAFDEQSMPGVTYIPEWARSGDLSPSPTRNEALRQAHADSSFTAHEPGDSGELALNGWPQVHRLNKTEDIPASDWSGMLSPPEEEKLQARSNFFDGHIEEVFGRVVERRLRPLEESLRNMQAFGNKRSKSNERPSVLRASSTAESDADDEDDLSDAPRHRPISRGKDKRVDEIKAAVMEALREQSPRRSQSSYDISDLHSALADMKVSFARAASASLELDDVRAVVEDVLNRQSQAMVPIQIEEGDRTHKREMSELEGRFNETLAGALEEANHRRAVEEREAEIKRMLRLAEEELQLLRNSSRDDDGRLSAMDNERRELLERAEKAEEAQQSAEKRASGLQAENEAMQGTLEEYRLSSTKWRHGIDEAQRERESLETTIAGLERQLEEGQHSGNSMRRRLEKLHSDMATAAGQLADEKAAWKAREEDYHLRCEALEAEGAAQARKRRELEEELRIARIGMAEVSEARLALDHTRASNVSLDELVRKLQADLVEQKALAARFERDFHDARESGRAEVNRTRMSLETDIETVNHQVNLVRAELESELIRSRTELESVKIEAETAKARHERLLEEEDVARRDAIRKVNLTSSLALDEARQKHDVALQDLVTQHMRTVQYATEDKHRSEYILNERLVLSDAKLQHSKDRILHLEERLQIAKSAAQAAVMSAQAKAAHSVPASRNIAEKVSPQALRESILVLQEQLQERETRIDRLQHQVDKEGPAQLKERDSEITWLRELFAVRSEDLTDLVNTLAKPTFDRDAVRDTAIRIRANLQMEQQEKERFGYGPQSLGGQALASLSSFATPKAVSLTSAFNKWRTTMESPALRNPPRSSSPVRTDTPSRPRPDVIPPNYMVGLMTPPASNVRNTPSPEATMSLPAPRLQGRDRLQALERPPAQSPRPDSRQVSSSSEGPATPLLREQSYDRDAKDNNVRMQSFEDDDLDIADSEAPAFRNLETELLPTPTTGTATP